MLDEFEVAVFLTETSSRHAILKKHKRAKNEKPRLGTTKGRLTGAGTQDVPVEVEDDGSVPVVREENQEDRETALGNIPDAEDELYNRETQEPVRGKDDPLFVSEGSENEELEAQQRSRPRKVKEESIQLGQTGGEDDKKKMAMDTTYDGFTIYGRILCLVIKRKGKTRGKELAGGGGQAMMEEWIASTQAAEGQLTDD